MENWNENSKPPASSLQVPSDGRYISFLQSLVFCADGENRGRTANQPYPAQTLHQHFSETQTVFWASNTFKTASSSWAQLNTEAELLLNTKHPMPYGFSSSTYPWKIAWEAQELPNTANTGAPLELNTLPPEAASAFSSGATRPAMEEGCTINSY